MVESGNVELRFVTDYEIKEVYHTKREQKWNDDVGL